MASSPAATAKPPHHPQRQKLIIRKNCRKIKDCSKKLGAGHAVAVEDVRGSVAALESLYEACTGGTEHEQEENERAVEAMLGPLPRFLGQLKSNTESVMLNIDDEKGTVSEDEREGRKEALQSLLVLSTDLHQRLQQRVDETLQTRKAWEEKHPVQAAQEHELSLYAESLLPLLDAPSARTIGTTRWQEVEKALASLQVYLLNNKISAQQVRSGGEKGIDPVLRNVLRKMEEWDAEGLGFTKDERVDLEVVEKIWGRVDKIASGLNYLLILDARGDAVEGVEPTTRSVFLRKSAPPASLRFASSQDAWLVERLSESRARLVDIVLDPGRPDSQLRDDEPRWSAAYRELEALERLVRRAQGPATGEHEAKSSSPETIGQLAGIRETVGLLCAKLESLHALHPVPPKADGDEGGAFALLYVSWELAMRIGAALGVGPPNTGP